MNSYAVFIPWLGLQLFAEGGGAATGATGVTAADAGPQNQGVNPQAGNVQDASAQQPEAQQPVDRQAEFDRLINGDYKDLFDKKTQDIVQKRLKSTKPKADKYDAIMPMLDMLATKYGVDSTDAEALVKAIEQDDSFYEDEALELGMTVQQLKQIKRMERENAALKRQQQEAEAMSLYTRWMQDSEQVKSIYPAFDLETELQNQQFQQLLRNGIDVRTAFEVIHKDEIMPAAMQYTARQVEQKLTNNIMANGMRPTENGTSASSPALTRTDPKALTHEQREELIRRAAAGERITFN